MKETMKRYKQAFYNMGFTNVKNLCKKFVFKARRLKFFEGWMAAMNTINLPKSSLFKDPAQIPLPNNPLVQALSEEQPKEIDDKEGGEPQYDRVGQVEQLSCRGD